MPYPQKRFSYTTIEIRIWKNTSYTKALKVALLMALSQIGYFNKEALL